MRTGSCSFGRRVISLLIHCAAVVVGMCSGHVCADTITDHSVLKRSHEEFFKGNYSQAVEEAQNVLALEGVSAAIQGRAYKRIAEALLLQGKEEESKEFLRDIVRKHATDNRIVDNRVPIPMSLDCRLIEAKAKELRFRRAGQYADAAVACQEYMTLATEKLHYAPSASKRAEMEWFMTTDPTLGDYWRFAGDYAKAAREYKVALGYLEATPPPETATTTSLAFPPYRYLHAKLPIVLNYCEGDPSDIAVKCGREIDGGLELADLHITYGKACKDRMSLQRARALYDSVKRFVESNDIPNALPEPLKGRYREVRKTIERHLAYVDAQ